MLYQHDPEEARRLLGVPNICVSCGFLALRSRDGELREADEFFRTGAEIDTARFASRRPLCAVRRADFAQEVRDYLASSIEFRDPDNRRRLTERSMNPQPRDILPVIQREDRGCERDGDQPYGWMEWSPGLSPKEHREILDRDFTVKREDERDAALRDWQVEQEERAERRHEEQERRAAAQHRELLKAAKTRFFWDIVIAGTAATLLLATATITGALIQSGVWTLPWAD